MSAIVVESQFLGFGLKFEKPLQGTLRGRSKFIFAPWKLSVAASSQPGTIKVRERDTERMGFGSIVPETAEGYRMWSGLLRRTLRVR